MNWEQVAVIVGVNITLIGAFITVAIWLVNKIDGDVKSIAADIKSTGDRIDAMGTRLDGHAMRIDQLYKMFIDLIKEGRK